jgi:hypothetical protein
MNIKGLAIKEKPVSHRLLASILCLPLMNEWDGVIYG